MITALSATSSDLERLNREVVDSVRFQFVEQRFFSKKNVLHQDKNNDNPEEKINQFYASGEELLSDVLSKGNYRHQKQLRYLAKHHAGKVLKIRFVLSPFSFVFLLEGRERYHLIMETLDTEEATYVWHLPKNINELKQEVWVIDKQFNHIRNEGRQKFLETNPENFSKVLHDYSEAAKGFILWKDSLEERIY